MKSQSSTRPRVFVAMTPLESSDANTLTLTGQGGRGKTTPRVFVAMSGGVDSSVAAALLKDAGYDVTGVFMRVWSLDDARDKSLDDARDKQSSFYVPSECTRADDREEAKRAAQHLGIPFLTFDIEEEYKREVVDYMVAEYRAGRTPNPDVMCNKYVKFGAFLNRAKALGADYIATGHYVRLRRTTIDNKPLTIDKKDTGQMSPSTIPLSAGGTGQANVKCQMLTGRDSAKDQSYFLWTLTQEQLKHVLFPVGEYEKPRVRELAREYGLPNAERRDSQGVCFIGKMDMREFLKHYIPEKPGAVQGEAGEEIGRHDGAVFYTLGQRHGFTVTKKTPDTPALYVSRKDIEANTITVSTQKPDEGGDAHEVMLEDVNWISGTTPENGTEVLVRFRYRQPLRSAKLWNLESGTWNLHFTERQNAVAAGQSLVCYRGEECIGGGVIVNTH